MENYFCFNFKISAGHKSGHSLFIWILCCRVFHTVSARVDILSETSTGVGSTSKLPWLGAGFNSLWVIGLHSSVCWLKLLLVPCLMWLSSMTVRPIKTSKGETLQETEVVILRSLKWHLIIFDILCLLEISHKSRLLSRGGRLRSGINTRRWEWVPS